jgi:tRNA (guanine37-N1)-methyltransferase
MVIMADPVFRAVEHLRSNGAADAKVVLLSPSGKKLTQRLARELASEPALILLCGHYEGFDERVVEGLKPVEVSIGDYVLTGGEIPAMVLVDCVTRLVPGVLGAAESLSEESHSDGRLEYPHYTRPREYRGMAVPDVLTSGHHAEIEKWRREQSLKRTRERRPDLAKRKRKG